MTARRESKEKAVLSRVGVQDKKVVVVVVDP